jgi:hypothetical protein
MIISTGLADFIFRRRENRKLLLMICAFLAIQFLVFKYFYPYPDFFKDSYSYIYAAKYKLGINTLPIGYSIFLRIVHCLTSFDTALIATQYILYGISAIYFFFTIRYLYDISKTTKTIIFIFLFLNPVFLYVCNYVSSEPLFISASIAWITSLLWILQRPNWYNLFFQSIILTICISLSQNSAYYILINAIAIIMSPQLAARKIIGIAASLLLVFTFIQQQRVATYNLTGVQQASLSKGWQVANNALYIRGYISDVRLNGTSRSMTEIDSLTRDFYQQTGYKKLQDFLPSFEGNFFSLVISSPLIVYQRIHFPLDTILHSDIANYGKSSVIFQEYGNHVIYQYPSVFLRHYMIPNMKNYLMPPLEMMSKYNQDKNSINTDAEEWFNYPIPTIVWKSKTIQKKLLCIFPFIFLFSNLLIILYLGLIIVSRQFLSINKKTGNFLTIALAYFFLTFICTTASSFISLRTEIFTMTFLVCYIALLSDKKIGLSSTKKPEIRTKIPKSNPLYHS